MARIALALLFGLGCLSGWAQLRYIAPDLRWDGDLHSYLGVANPQASPTTITLIGYGPSGEELGRQDVELGAFHRREWAANEMFSTSEVKWAEIHASIAIGPYVRYAHTDGKRMSLAALNTIDGDEAFVPQTVPFPEIEGSQIVLVNSSQDEGQAFVQPVLIKRGFSTAGKAEDAVAIEGFGPAGSQAKLEYDALFQKDKVTLIWDKIFTEGGKLAAMQHLGNLKAESGQLASLALPRTTHRDMIIGPIDPNDETERYTRFMLINTFETPLRAVVTAYYPQEPAFLFDGGYTITRTYELGPLEKRIFEFNNFEENDLPAHAQWYRVQPYEGGLIGYQIIGDRNSNALAACESVYRPSSVVTLPYTPSNEDVTTHIGLINPTENHVTANVGGFDENGKLVAYRGRIGISPYEKRVFRLEELFGSQAGKVAWTRAAVTTGELSAMAYVLRHDGADMGAYLGVPYLANDGQSFFANFEYFFPDDLQSQGWETMYLDGYDRRIFATKQAGKASALPALEQNQYHHDHAFPRPGTFYMETQFQAKSGFFYLGYEPLFGFNYGLLDPPVDDTAMFLSPYFEVDLYGDNYLTYYMRLMQPDSTTEGSEYGLVFREEGTNEFTWFGINGTLLAHPPISLRDCYVEVYYRCWDVFITDWLPFQYKLPDSLRGKRIQVGLYYRQLPGDDAFSEVPRVYIDDISIKKKALDRFNFFPEYGFGTFQVNEEE